ncbi:MAG TPA: class I adenylate-forming enzyme family protein [Acidimicrobiales bacterium]|nr:class I adenylate-forming enzyme family protein [Acidimicrobiales bacterium]
MTTMFDAVGQWAAAQPDALALVTETDGTRTYGELVHNAAAIAAALHGELAVAPGETVTLLAANQPQWVEAYLGAGAAGLRCVAGNPEWTDPEVEFILEHSRSTAVICDHDLAARMVALKDAVPRLRHVVAFPAAGGAAAGAPVAGGALSYAELLSEAPGDPGAALPPEGFGFSEHIMYTSGTTTGRPKAVVNEAGQLTGADYREMFGLESKDRGILVTPFFHGNGMGGLMAVLLHGASVVFPRRFSASRFWDLVDLYRPTFLWTLAPLVNILMGRPESPRERRHDLRVLIVLGAARTAPLIEERFGAPLIDWYGMTEAGFGTYTRLGEERRPGSAGRRFPGSTMTVQRGDGTEAAPDEEGEVVFRRGTIAFDGYLRDEEATAAVIDAEWFHTGDLGYFDEDGYFFFVDRKKDIVRRGGENISSMEIEGVVRLHPHVADVAVLGKPDPVLGERVVAFVVPSEEHPEPDVASIQEYVGERLARFKVPEEIYLVDELPRTSTGKIIKAGLRLRIPT